MFNPISFLDSAGLDYEVRGVRIVCQCPWCGDSDVDGDNYGFRTDRTAWGCFRDKSHTGSLAWVLTKLAGWTLAQATEYLGGGVEKTPLDELRRRQQAMGKPKEAQAQAELSFPREFRIIRNVPPTERFHQYLASRGFPDVQRLCSRFSLMCANEGRFHDRIILPVFIGDRLVGWTARALGKARLRYMAEPEGGEVKDALFGESQVMPGRDLYIVEGPFDAMKLDACGKASAIALMGTAATPAQAGGLRALAKRAARTFILLDAAARAEAQQLRADLPGAGAIVRVLPRKWKDPGAAPIEALAAFLDEV